MNASLMEWLGSIDAALFNFLNQTIGNRFLDAVLPMFSWNVFFIPCLAIASLALIWKGGVRGRIFVVLSFLVLVIGDSVICNSLKEWIHRARPFESIPSVNVLVGRGESGSMPSSHAANWVALTVVAAVYYRKSICFLLPLAVIIGFSRVYLGAHYPSDVLAGAVLGASYAGVIIWGLNRAWIELGRRWFPFLRSALPALVPSQETDGRFSNLRSRAQGAWKLEESDPQWIRLGYLLISVLLATRLAYVLGGTIELSEDEAYQWLWSKHLALSYFSKPPLIAYTQFLGTSIWGDSSFGIRFFSPVIAAALSVMILRFAAREASPRAAFWLIAVITTIPLMAVGAVLMTIDSLSVLFWTAAMLSGWRAVQGDLIQLWLLTGLWIGMAFLSKYMAPFQLLCWTVFFVLWKPARVHLRRPGPYLALLIAALCTIPVVLWNSQHDWITVTHLKDRGGLDQTWRFTTRFLFDFTLAEFGLMNHVYFVGMFAASIAIWRQRTKNAFLVYCFSMSVPLFLAYWAYSFRARVQPNWIAPAILPLACLMVVYWNDRWREGARGLKKWLTFGLVFGGVVIVPLHNTDLIRKVTGYALPPAKDPKRRVKGWIETANVVEAEYRKLIGKGTPVFVIGGHYGITSLLSFYWPEAKKRILEQPLVFYRSSDVPINQFYFWPGYSDRKGSSALYVAVSQVPLRPPEGLAREFASVIDLGMRDVVYRGRILHRLQLFKCVDLL